MANYIVVTVKSTGLIETDFYTLKETNRKELANDYLRRAHLEMRNMNKFNRTKVTVCVEDEKGGIYQGSATNEYCTLI